MASMKASKEDTAEAAASAAPNGLSEANQERRQREDSRASKTSELKASAMEAARKAREYLTGKKMETMQTQPKEKYQGTEDEARKRMEEVKLKEEGVKDEAKQRAEADRETAADRGIAAKNNILSAMGGVAGSIKEKLTMPSDIRDEACAAQEFGGPKRGKKIEVSEEETP